MAFENLQAIDRILERDTGTQTVSECCNSQSKHWWNADLWRMHMQVTSVIWNLRNSTIKTVSQGGILELQGSSFGLNLSAPLPNRMSSGTRQKDFWHSIKYWKSILYLSLPLYSHDLLIQHCLKMLITFWWLGLTLYYFSFLLCSSCGLHILPVLCPCNIYHPWYLFSSALMSPFPGFCVFFSAFFLK